MKRLVFITVFVLSALIGFSQLSKDEMFKKNGEVYFQFQVSEKKDISWITKIISIANVEGKTVYAYANETGLAEFETSGIPYTLLPHPNEGSNPVMKDYDELKNTNAWDAYPTYPAYVAMMYAFETNYPGLCDVFSIGTTVNGRQLLVAKISDNVSSDEAEPEFFYTSSMHGNETTGYVLMLRLIDSLLTTYTTSPRIANLVNNIEIYINPLANPDGTYKTGDNSVSGAVRYNANNIDLNRNFPDVIDGLYPNTQQETYAFMNFAEGRNFVLSCNLHGGAEVCNYPWDHKYPFCADDSWWQYVCHEYADTCQMYAPSNYMNGYDDGITNGADWYVIDGGRQDYMNFYHQCREFTLEISDAYILPAASLPAYWGYNRRSFLNYLEQCTFGIRGMVTDAVTGLPVQAEIFVLSHDIVGDSSWVYSSPLGNYHRLLNAGSYNLRVSAPCYEPQIFNNISVTNKNATYLNVQLAPQNNAVNFTSSATSISIGGTVSFYDQSCGNPTSWLWSITGPGTGVFVSGTSNTSQNPVVQFNTSGSYTVSLTATSAGGTYTQTKTDYINVINCTVATFPWTEGFENGGNIPTCWSQEFVLGSLNWIYQNGGYSGHPATAHSGSFNALLYKNSASSSVTKLVTPPINLSLLSNPVLTFWHAQALWSTDQDELRIYYKTSSSGTWNLLQTYTSNVTAWTQRTINLPGTSNTYYLAFQGTAKYGYGVCIDDVTVNGTLIPLAPIANFMAGNTTPFVGQTVTFTDQSSNSPNSWAWSFSPSTVTYSGGTTSESQNPIVQFDAPGFYSVQLTATNAAGSDTEIKTDYIEVLPLDFYLDLNVMLEGSFNGIDMNTNLTLLDEFPLSQPYSGLPWNYPGSETVTSIPAGSVDWVLIELRDATTAATATAATRIARQAAFLLSDGSVVGIDGISNLQFNNSIIQQLFIVVWHRNHLPVLTAYPLVKTVNTYTYDFTTGTEQAFGIGAQKMLNNGIYGLIGGDANADGIVDDLDKTISWQSEAGLSGYLSFDLSMDGQSSNQDKNQIWLPNWGKGTQVP